MVVIIFCISISLTFLLTLLKKVMEYLIKKEINVPEVIRQNLSYLWLGIIVIVGGIGGSFFNLALPNSTLTIKSIEWLYFLMLFYLFCAYSGYPTSKTLREYTKFALVFPIGEEILFRGILQSTIKSLLVLDGQYVNLPLFGSVPVVVLISAICFGVTHFQYHNFKVNELSLKQVALAFVFGIFAGNVVEMTGSIIYPLLFHIAANTGAVLYGKYVKSSPKELTKT